jgi:hypothetical protein
MAASGAASGGELSCRTATFHFRVVPSAVAAGHVPRIARYEVWRDGTVLVSSRDNTPAGRAASPSSTSTSSIPRRRATRCGIPTTRRWSRTTTHVGLGVADLDPVPPLTRRAHARSGGMSPVLPSAPSVPSAPSSPAGLAPGGRERDAGVLLERAARALGGTSSRE